MPVGRACLRAGGDRPLARGFRAPIGIQWLPGLPELLLAEAAPRPPRVHEPVAVVAREVQGAEADAGPLGERVAHDHEVIGALHLDLEPVGKAPCAVGCVGALTLKPSCFSSKIQPGPEKGSSRVSASMSFTLSAATFIRGAPRRSSSPRISAARAFPSRGSSRVRPESIDSRGGGRSPDAFFFMVLSATMGSPKRALVSAPSRTSA